MTTNHDRAMEWLRMALRDFERAKQSFINEDYSDSVFRAQQGNRIWNGIGE